MAGDQSHSPSKRGKSTTVTAKWDDNNTRVMLEVFAEQIKKGNRPAGVYSSGAWKEIGNNFQDRTGLAYTREQLKNRFDVCKLIYQRWKKAVGHETGLGWNHARRTVDAPNEWWEAKAKENKECLKWRNEGPVHLYLLEEVFGDTVATGWAMYVPGETDSDPENDDPLLRNGGHIDVGENPGDERSSSDEPTEVYTKRKAPVSMKAKKKDKKSGKRSKQSKEEILDESMQTVLKGLENMSQPSVCKFAGGEKVMTYGESLSLLSNLLPKNETYWKICRILEDPLKRVGFEHATIYGMEAIMGWFNTFQ